MATRGPALHQIACPVVLVTGLAPHEGGPDAAAHERTATIPSFVLAPLPGVGLYPFEEAPNLVADVIRGVAPIPHEAIGASGESRQLETNADLRLPIRRFLHEAE